MTDYRTQAYEMLMKNELAVFLNHDKELLSISSLRLVYLTCMT